MSYAVRLVRTNLARLPQWLQPYVISLGALLGAFLAASALLYIFGLKIAVLISLLGDLVFLGSAWLGYGPGILSCTLIVFVVPRLLLPSRPHPVDLGQYALLLFISILVSRISASKRRSEALLRQWGEQLARGIEERTRELKRNEQSLAWLAAIVESSDDAIIGGSLDGIVTSWNRGAEALYGYASHEIVGRSMEVLSSPSAPDDLARCLRSIQSGEALEYSETTHIRKNGSPVVVSLSISPIRDSMGTILGMSTIARDMTARRAASEALERSEKRYRALFENNPQPMWVYDQKTLAFLTVNDTAIRSYGYSREEFLSMTLKDIRPQEDVVKLLAVTAVPTTTFNQEGPWRHLKKDGKIISVEITEHPLQFEDRPACLVMAMDITDRMKLEEQFRQAQRLESVGRLAGGVAHDFNNLLTVINGYAEMLMKKAAPNDPVKIPLREIREAGERAAELTKQLLAFSRRQVMQLSVINLNETVAGTGALLRRLIGEDIKLISRLSPDLGLIQADTGQIQQLIMNLAVNSRDAMPNGGTLLIETGNVLLDESYRVQHPEVRPGPHVMLAITDTGSGMTPEVRARIFEPFFTTKELGKGTGLGLATVYGVVKQAGGWIWVYSEPGQGTTFKIYLPRTDKAASQAAIAFKGNLHGDETILLIEDQPEVRRLAHTGLARFGYSVHEASTGREAVLFCREFQGPLHLVVTDVVMPDMNGRQVAAEIQRIRPESRILFMSGYTADVIVHHGVLDDDVEYLQKPFTPDSLARKVREVLAKKSGAGSGEA